MTSRLCLVRKTLSLFAGPGAVGATGRGAACTSVTVPTPGLGGSRRCHCAREPLAINRRENQGAADRTRPATGCQATVPSRQAACPVWVWAEGLRPAAAAGRLGLTVSSRCPPAASLATQAPALARLCLPANLCRAGPRRGPCAVSPFPKSHGTPQRARKQGLLRGCSPLSPPNTGDAEQAGPPSGQRRCPVDRSAADKPAAMGEGAGPGSGAWGRPGPATALGRVVTPGLVSTQTGDGDQVGK